MRIYFVKNADRVFVVNNDFVRQHQCQVIIGFDLSLEGRLSDDELRSLSKLVQHEYIRGETIQYSMDHPHEWVDVPAKWAIPSTLCGVMLTKEDQQTLAELVSRGYTYGEADELPLGVHGHAVVLTAVLADTVGRLTTSVPITTNPMVPRS